MLLLGAGESGKVSHSGSPETLPLTEDTFLLSRRSSSR